MPRSAAFEEVIAGIYDAAAEPSSWAAHLAEMQLFLGAETVLASLQQRRTGEVGMLACNFPEPIVRGYATTWWPHDPWMLGAEQAGGRVVSGDECLSQTEFLRTPIYNELVRPHLALRQMLGVVFPVEDRHVVLGVHRLVGGKEFSGAERQAMTDLLPHIRRSLQLMLRLQASGQTAALARMALDAIPHALLMVDRESRPIVANGAAERMLARADGLTGGSWGRPVAARGMEETRTLHRLVHAAAGTPCGPGGALRIADDAGATLYALLVVPLVGRSAGRFGLSRPAALLLIHDVRAVPLPRRRILVDLYRLTAAEAELADHIARGARLEDVAAERGVRLSTLRSQLHGLLQKTGTDRQSSLVRLLTTLALTGRYDNRE